MLPSQFKTPVVLSLFVALFLMLAAYGSQPVQSNSNSSDTVASQLPMSIAPAYSAHVATEVAPAGPTDLELAVKAAADNQWEQVIHYADRAMSDQAALSVAFGLFTQAHSKLADQSLAQYDNSRGPLIRSAFDKAKHLLNEASNMGTQILHADRSHMRSMSPGDVKSVMDTLQTIAQTKQRLDERRYDAFKGFATTMFEKVEAHFTEGKGQHWWENDDEEKFMTALEHLNRIHAVVDELRDSDRELVLSWDSTLKSELSEAQYTSAIHRSQFVDGKPQ